MKKKYLQDSFDRVSTVEDGFSGHAAKGLVSFAQLFLKGSQGLLQIHLFATQLVPFSLKGKQGNH